MQNKILILILLSTNFLFSKCLQNEERKKLISEVNNKAGFYFDVPNYIECKEQNIKLNKFVCKNSDYLLMFHYLSQVNVYKYEDILKHEVNHKKFNKDNMKYWHKNFNSNHLCFDLKASTTDFLGGESPYKITTDLKDNKYFIQENKYGIVLTNREGYKIYLGKTCDTLDSNNKKGRWSKISNRYLIKLDGKEFNIDYLEIDNAKYKCLE